MGWSARSGHKAPKFYSDTTCYALSDDSYDSKYGLADWHGRLDIKQVKRSADPEQLPFGSGAFDAVISSGVLEHVGECGVDERVSLSELRRVLKLGGYFFIWNLPRKYGREYFYTLLRRAMHQRRYRKSEIISLLEHAGFSVRFFTCHELLPLSVLKKLEPAISPVTLVNLDYALAERLGFLAQNFTIVAKAI